MPIGVAVLGHRDGRRSDHARPNWHGVLHGHRPKRQVGRELMGVQFKSGVCVEGIKMTDLAETKELLLRHRPTLNVQRPTLKKEQVLGERMGLASRVEATQKMYLRFDDMRHG